MKSVAASSAESEYCSASRSVREAKWLRYLFSDMGYGDLKTVQHGKFCDQDFARVQLSDLVDPKEQPILLMVDNKAAIAISKNPVLHKRSKHIHIAYHIVRREVAKKNVVMAYIPTNENIADMMTKSLKKNSQQHLADKILVQFDGKNYSDVKGEPLEPIDSAPLQREMYKTEPLGLQPDKFDEEPADEEIELQEAKGPTSEPAGGAAVNDGYDWHRWALNGEGAPWEGSGGADIERMQAAIEFGMMVLAEALASDCSVQTILDTGASKVYVAGRQTLRDAKPGEGSVRVANGQIEPIAEEGKLGPLPAEKVTSFHRNLVGGGPVVDKFGIIALDKTASYLVTPRSKDASIVELLSDACVVTRIAKRTINNLYEMDLAMLRLHDEKVRGS